ncbi:hypothetical protein PB2503_10974 [Parvularcula bermudensis HTCC2503]|uniref:DUF4167 domain-containing protein n=2 Tax=Parvularcula TaxID=208215 RepID=E0THU9_PARBH|nr:DUF4167 domain-containing protein [Parvularcula bermudensis]ADM10242.1 hypothetical protein PB2503_10974 [Parvularcula bermudensis HTCC2503]
MAQNSKRGRNSNRRRQGGNNPNRSFDSTGPEVKIRGTATQIYDKYQALARDAASSGDRIRAESLLQHAEHYFRMMKAMQTASEKAEENRQASQGDRNDPQGHDSQGHDDSQTEDEAPTEKKSRRKESDETSNKDDRDQEGETAAESDSGTDTTTNGDQEDPAPRRRRPRRRRQSDEANGDETPPKADETQDNDESVSVA